MKMKKLGRIIYYSVLTLIVTSFASMFGNKLWIFLIAWGKARADYDQQLAILDSCGTDVKTVNLFGEQCKNAREILKTWPSGVALGSVTDAGISCGDMPCSALIMTVLNSWVGIATVLSVMGVALLLASKFIDDYRNKGIYIANPHEIYHSLPPNQHSRQYDYKF